MLTYESKVNKGKLPTSITSDIRAFLEANEGKWVKITLNTLKSQRSTSQNAYYHAAVIPIVKQALKNLGHQLTSNEVHEFLKDKFIEAEPMITEDGVLIGYRDKHTSTLNKTQFMEYIANIQQFSAEILGAVIPDPNQQTEINL